MGILFSSALILACLSVSLSAQRCRCVAPADGETTRSGANEHIVLVEKRKHTGITGIVRDTNGETISDVLVEGLDHPEHLLLSYPENIEKQKAQRRVAACVTGNDGRFCFTSIPAGKYELRLSKNGGWKHTSLYLVVAPRDPKATKRGLGITLQVGT
jgi:protocatechuate 3,4-dioxygenase beta subunit